MASSIPVARRVIEGTQQALQNAHVKLGASLLVNAQNNSFLKTRVDFFQRLFSKQERRLEELQKKQEEIHITLPDGTRKSGVRYQTTPLAIAAMISKKLASEAIVAKLTPTEEVSSAAVVCADVEDDSPTDDCCQQFQLWDLTRPLEFSCVMELLTFDAEEGQHVFWHSSSHILGAALESLCGAHLTIGPALERGFYYDAYLGDTKISQDMYTDIETHANTLIKTNAPFQRLVLDKPTALEMFKANPFKSWLIQTKVPEGALTTVYRCGDLVDLCRGPHLPTTGKVLSFCVEKHSSAYWLGNDKNDSLQRVYGISFPSTKQMKQYKTMVEEAKKRDHRILGKTLNYFFFETNLSPGSCFWLPDGAKFHNRLTDFMRKEYRHRGFTEVLSPNIFSCDIFKVSGHYQNYKENMYCFDVEGKEWALKPMNCPGHCLMFRQMNPSYRQLPLRLADFGVLHRNEASGSLTGLIRVRRFQQDDAHIFCRADQIQTEVKSALDFLFYVYGVFGFKFEMKLSTRPKKALGTVELWKQAEDALAKAMDATGKPWKTNPGDGAFYGPKIDIRLQDALQRWHQCGTVQLDFQLPLRFNLTYRNEEITTKSTAAATLEEIRNHDAKTVDTPINGVDKTVQTDNSSETAPTTAAPGTDSSWETPLRPGFERPVMIHRAILGSIERMAAVLLEHTAGKFPFWLSPRQAIVCPISEKNLSYAQHVAQILRSKGYDVAVDESNTTISKKIRQAQLDRWNYSLVVGAQEQAEGTVMVRDRDDAQHQVAMTLQQLLDHFASLKMPCSDPLVVVSELPSFSLNEAQPQ